MVDAEYRQWPSGKGYFASGRSSSDGEKTVQLGGGMQRKYCETT
jgi:hypothetical protein